MSKTPELEPPKFELMKLASLKAHTKELFGFTPRKRTLEAAHQEVLDRLEADGHELPYLCENCNSLIDEEISKCWACGAAIEEEGEEPEMVEEEVRARAEDLEIPTEGKDREALTQEVQAKEKRNRAEKKVDLVGIESAKLNEKLTDLMPDGWRKSKAKQYTGYVDPSGIRRLAVFDRGLTIHFVVEDGFLDKLKDLEFYDPAERKRRHYGRVNYCYVGDVAKDALEICRRVMRRYAAGG